MEQETWGFGLAVRFTALTEKGAEELESEARLMLQRMATSDKEKGTLVYAIHRVPNEPRVRVFYELYTSRKAHKSHTKSEHYLKFEAKTKPLLKEFGGLIVTDLEVAADMGLPPTAVPIA